MLRGLAARNERFTGRENDLGELRDELRGTRRAVVRPLTLLGTAGVGKTAIALEYAHRFMNDYDLVCWIPCGQSEEVDLRVAELLPALRDRFGISPPPGESTVAERARMVLDVLADGETVPRWLLIYDNAEDIGTIREYLPSSGGQVLITSQNKSWEEHNVRTLQVRMFDRQESVAHLSRVVPSLTGDEADALADALGDLPVAVTAVAVYLRDSGYPVARYLSDLEQRQPSAPSVGVLSVYPREVAGAWDAPLRLLKARSEAAARLLELCSVMASDIATELVHSRAMAEVLEPFDPALAAPLIMGRIVQEASKLNLLTIDAANKQITVHRVVQTVVRSRMSAAEVAAARAEVQQILLAARPRRDVDDPEARNRFRMIWPHLGPAEVVSSTDERVRELIIDRIRYIYVYSDYARGVAEATAAVAEWQEMLNSGLESRARRSLHTQLLQLQFNLGLILLAQSKFTESRKLHAQVLEEQTELLKADHPYTLMTAGSLAADLRALGLYQNALKLDRQTHPAWVALYGDDNLWSLRSANNLAVSFRLNGDVNAALQLDRETYQRTLSTLGNRHRLTLSSHQNLARDLLECGEYRAAVDTARHAYRLAAEHMGPDSSRRPRRPGPARDRAAQLGTPGRGRAPIRAGAGPAQDPVRRRRQRDAGRPPEPRRQPVVPRPVRRGRGGDVPRLRAVPGKPRARPSARPGLPGEPGRLDAPETGLREGGEVHRRRPGRAGARARPGASLHARRRDGTRRPAGRSEGSRPGGAGGDPDPRPAHEHARADAPGYPAVSR